MLPLFLLKDLLWTEENGCVGVCVWRGCATRLRSWPIRCIESRDWTKSHSLSESCHWFKGKWNSLEKSVVLTAALLTAQWRPDQQEGAAQALLNLIRSVVYGHLFCFVFPLPPPDECKSSFFCSRCGNVEQKKKERRGKRHFLFTSRYDTERRVKTKSSSWFLFSFFSPFSKTGHTGDPLHIMTVAYKHTPGISTRCPVCFSCKSSCLRPSVSQEGPTEWFWECFFFCGGFPVSWCRFREQGEVFSSLFVCLSFTLSGEHALPVFFTS